MSRGLLSEYFVGIAFKRLSAVEAHPERSHQHEFNGVQQLRSILGSEKTWFPTQFVYLTDDDDEVRSADGFVTWYDARQHHPTRSEYRLYFPTTSVSDRASEGDLAVIARRGNGTVLVAIADEGTTAENQLRWLFNLTGVGNQFQTREVSHEDRRLGFAATHLLSQLGIETELQAPPLDLDALIDRFDGVFPDTVTFSEFARTTLGGVRSTDDPDTAVIAWLEREEALFRALERQIVSKRLRAGFGSDGEDVEAFVQFSLQVHNRRKSRAGYSAENHLEQVFREHGLEYSRNKRTEGKSKPDFIFPNIDAYHDPTFERASLCMLGVKTTCKERWRQILDEADHIPTKHLFTLETSISEDQTDAMRTRLVQLVLPAPLHETFTGRQRSQLLSLRDFIELIASRQR
jgi:hypothetical protein